MPDDSIALLSAAELARRVRARELSPVEVLEACLARVEALGPAINAVVTPDPRAMDEARALERRIAAGEDVGPLAGVPVGIKDVTQVGGLRTTFGSPLFSDHVPEEDALVVRRLRAAGAVIVGKTNTPQFAAGGHTLKQGVCPPRKPRGPPRHPGR